MATIRLVPSAYTLSSTNTSYISLTNASNMYKNTDTSSSYATLKGRNSNSTYYLYIHGFNFSDVPSNASVSSFSVKIRAYRNSYTSTSSSYYMSLYNNTTSISNTTVSSALTTSFAVYTFPIPSNLTWSTIKGYGNNFRIRVPIRRSSSTPYIYISGAEIEVTYTVPNPRTITSVLTGSGTISPAGAQTYYDGDTYTLTITPAVSGSVVSATKDGNSISLVNHTTYYTYSYTVSGDATINVTIVPPVAATVTSTITGYGTISPSGATSTYEGVTYTLTITPDESTYTVTATKNNVDITGSLVSHTTYYTYSYTVDGDATIAVIVSRPAKLWVRLGSGTETQVYHVIHRDD